MNRRDQAGAKGIEALNPEQASCARMWSTIHASGQNETFHLKETFVISNNRDSFVEVSHRDSDPSVWIVRRWTKFLWFRKRVSSDWFINRSQAFAYAKEMKREHDSY
jgi:hypothetical protein